MQQHNVFVSEINVLITDDSSPDHNPSCALLSKKIIEQLPEMVPLSIEVHVNKNYFRNSRCLGP